MLIAAIRSGSPLAGKAVSFSEDDGKFWLTGVGEISPESLVEYERAGELEWADDSTRSWALEKAGVGATASTPPAPPPAAVSEGQPETTGAPPGPPPEAERPTLLPDAEPVAAASEERATFIPAPLARRGKRAERPDFVAGERRRWRPSEMQWRTMGYIAIALAMIAAVIVMGIWRLGSDEPTGTGPSGVVVQLQGSSPGSSKPFDLTTGTHRLSFTVERSSLGMVSEYTFSIVPAGTPADEQTNFAVESGIIDPGYAPGAKSGSVVFDRDAGSYYLMVFSNNCAWTAMVSAKE